MAAAAAAAAAATPGFVDAWRAPLSVLLLPATRA